MAARPVRLVDPFITLGTAGVGPPVTVAVDLTCFAKGIHLTPEEDDAAATFCDPLGFSWVLTLDLLQSLGMDGLEEALTSLGGPGTVLPFEFAYTKDVASIDNPHWTGDVRLTAYPIVDSGINEVTEINMEMDVIGDVTKDDGAAVTVVGAAGHSHSPYVTDTGTTTDTATDTETATDTTVDETAVSEEVAA